MPNYLNVPPKLNHLIEKRDGPQRRQSEHRNEQGQTPENVAAEDLSENQERRQENRRTEDS